jgi:dTDP-L-rhamnose 4-epimerase
MSAAAKVLVTGGAGFIGSHVVDRLVARGDDVVILDNLDPQVHGESAALPPHVSRAARFIHGDVRDAAAVRAALEGVDAVIHLAAAVGVGQSMYAQHYYTSVNVDGQGVLQEAMVGDAARYRRFVVASSMSIYGEGAYHCATHGEIAPQPRGEAQLARTEWELMCPHCGTPLTPVLTGEAKPLQYSSIYAITKKTQEELALCFGAAYGIPTLALRFFNVFGSRQALSNPYTGVAAIFMSRLKNGRAPVVFEDGRQSRDFIHVSDVAAAVVRALDAPADTSGAANVCTGRPITVGQVAEVLAERLGVDIAPEIVCRYRAGDIRHCVGDPSLARERLGFEARLSFAEGLDELLAWAEREQAEDRVGASMTELEQQHLIRGGEAVSR